MKFSLCFDFSVHAAGNQNNEKKKVTESSSSSNPREGRYFHRAEKDPVLEFLEDHPDALEPEEPSEKTDAKDKPVGSEIPEVTVEGPSDTDEDRPIEEVPPSEDDDDIVSESIDEEERELNELLKDFESSSVAEESVGRETPMIPSILREVEAEDSETPIPLNVGVAVKRETANVKVDPQTYVDKEAEKKREHVKMMIAKFPFLPITRKKDMANEIYNYIIANNVDYDLQKNWAVWKLVDRAPLDKKK